MYKPNIQHVRRKTSYGPTQPIKEVLSERKTVIMKYNLLGELYPHIPRLKLEKLKRNKDLDDDDEV